MIQNNFVDFKGLNELENVDGRLAISYNRELETLSGLSSLVQIGDTCTLGIMTS